MRFYKTIADKKAGTLKTKHTKRIYCKLELKHYYQIEKVASQNNTTIPEITRLALKNLGVFDTAIELKIDNLNPSTNWSIIQTGTILSPSSFAELHFHKYYESKIDDTTVRIYPEIMLCIYKHNENWKVFRNYEARTWNYCLEVEDNRPKVTNLEFFNAYFTRFLYLTEIRKFFDYQCEGFEGSLIEQVLYREQQIAYFLLWHLNSKQFPFPEVQTVDNLYKAYCNCWEVFGVGDFYHPVPLPIPQREKTKLLLSDCGNDED